MNGAEEYVTTENEIPRRLAKLEDAIAHHTAAHQKKDPLDRITPIVAILALCGIEAFAIYKGADGTMFAPIVAVIAAIAGVKMGDTIRDIFGGKK